MDGVRSHSDISERRTRENAVTDLMPPWDASNVLLLASTAALLACLVVSLVVIVRRRGDALENAALDEALHSGCARTVGELRASYAQRRARLDAALSTLEARIQALRNREFRSYAVVDVLEAASREEMANIASVLGLERGVEPAKIVAALRKAGSHSVKRLWHSEYDSYEEIATAVAVRLGLPKTTSTLSASVAERHAIEQAFSKVFDSVSPSQRAELVAEIARRQGVEVGTLTTAGGALVAAHLAGFGLYMAASSSLAAVAGAIGIVLPFAVYTGMSSILAFVTGPIAWVAFGAWAIFKLGTANYKKTVPCVLAIGAIRVRLTAERDAEPGVLQERQLGEFAVEAQALDELCRRLERVSHLSPDQPMPAH